MNPSASLSPSDAKLTAKLAYITARRNVRADPLSVTARIQLAKSLQASFRIDWTQAVEMANDFARAYRV